jgi:hypothetical protein
MKLEKIKGERAIRALKPGAGRLNDGGGLYLVPFAWRDSHYWLMDYTGLQFELAHAHVIDHALAQRGDGFRRWLHGPAPVEERGVIASQINGGRLAWLRSTNSAEAAAARAA